MSFGYLLASALLDQVRINFQLSLIALQLLAISLQVWLLFGLEVDDLNRAILAGDQINTALEDVFVLDK